MRYLIKNEKAEEKMAKVNEKRKSILYYRDNSSNTCGWTTIYRNNPRCSQSTEEHYFYILVP
jgi:hypothetical protein